MRAVIIIVVSLFFPATLGAARINGQPPAVTAVVRACAEDRALLLRALDTHNYVLHRGATCLNLSRDVALDLIFQMNAIGEEKTALGSCIRAAIPQMTQAFHRGREWRRAERDLAAAKGEPRIVTVLYATDRRPTGNLIPSFYYSGERDDLEVGKVRVSVPPDRRVGEIPRPESGIFSNEQLDTARHFYMGSPEPLPNVGKFREMFLRLSEDWGSSQALIFVHGYNNGFEDAVLRTAQLAVDLRFEGPVIVYSWASRGEPQDYTRDEATARSAVVNSGQFVSEMLEGLCEHQIHLIAHSMGSRLVVDALRDRTFPQLLFDELIFAAPDVDRQVFQQSIKLMAAASRGGITVYSSSSDLALFLSEIVHGFARAGQGGLRATERVDVIDASGYAARSSHAYFAEDSILQDIFYVLCCDMEPAKRYGLDRDQEGAGRWILTPH